jgi:hypothetical protein
MPDIQIRFAKKGHERGSIRIRKFSANLAPRVRKGISDAARILELRIKENLSGPSHTQNPGTSNPYPGVVSGNLRGSVTSVFEDQGFTAIIGPGGLASAYAAAQEFTVGGGRPYVKPAFEDSVAQIERLFEEQVFGNL